MARAGEFDLIARHFAPLAGAGGLGLKDDAAVMSPPEGRDLVLTVDANVAGVHFLADEAPDIVARRLLRTNLSDLAAKGARPEGYLLTLMLGDDADDDWIGGFAAGLGVDQLLFGIALFGGDTVSTPGPSAASITAIGSVPAGGMVRRSGARAGDDLYVTGTIGDGLLGLAAAQGELAGLDAADRDWLATRFRLPSPRLAIGAALRDAGATAAADVSDGLIADAGHIASASGVDLVIDAATVPLSAPARRSGRALADLLSGGDDYELVFTAPPAAAAGIAEAAVATGVPVARIGSAGPCASGEPQVVVRGPDGRALNLARQGYRHR